MDDLFLEFTEEENEKLDCFLITAKLLEYEVFRQMNDIRVTTGERQNIHLKLQKVRGKLWIFCETNRGGFCRVSNYDVTICDILDYAMKYL